MERRDRAAGRHNNLTDSSTTRFIALAIGVSERDLSFSLHYGQEQPFFNSFECLIWKRKRHFDTNKRWLHSIALPLCDSSTSWPYTRTFSRISLLRKGERLCGLVEGHGGWSAG